MKKYSLFAIAAVLAMVSCSDDVHVCEDRNLEQQLISSGFLHSILNPDYSNSLDARNAGKAVLDSVRVGIDARDWRHRGEGELSFGAVQGAQEAVTMSYDNLTGRRAVGSPDDPDYATFGECSAVLDLHGFDAGEFNRVSFRIYPDCDGARVTEMHLDFDSQASHHINLRNKCWNDCSLEIGDFTRDSLRFLEFSNDIRGRDMTTGEKSVYHIAGIRFEKIECPEKITGWEPMDGKVIFSTSGYLPDSPKTAIVSANTAGCATRFSLLKGKHTVYRGKVRSVETSLGRFGVLDFSSFRKEGVYTLRLGDIETRSFRISDNLWIDTQWRLLNYIYGQRCGSSVPGVHGKCHEDLMADHNGISISYGGGWHDAGDLSQQTVQTGDVTFALLEAYDSYRESSPVLAARLLEEARWGLDFILKCRFGDGYHASSMGLLHWTDNKFGSYDDIHTVRTQNNALDNFLYAAYEAYAAMTIDDDPMMAGYLKNVAEEDFGFAVDKFRKDGFDKYPHIMEHVYNSSESQFMATASWAASMLYSATGESGYASLAAEFMDYVLDCQHTEPLSDGTCGFFYRNPSHDVPVHFIHQSRDQIFAQALVLICRTQPENAHFSEWDGALRMYADYLKGMMHWTAPYGMVPSGVYRSGEYNDTESFNRLHIFAPHDAQERFDKQLEYGEKIEEGYYVRRFPVWFNIYNGNAAIMLSTGKAAAVLGNYLGDRELLDIGLEQLYWTVGKNPFGQSLIFGEGSDYPQMDSFSSGEFVGEIPVGIRSYGDEDIPYWPNVNNACYKEVWVTSAGKALSLISEFGLR